MPLKYTTIDPKTASHEEIRAEIERMKSLSNEWKNEEQAVKLAINSIYGALGNKWLACFNPEVAETITAQGQDLIKFAEKVVNKYFAEFWHQDTELHTKLGITGEVKPVIKPVNIYSDTDSCYISFEEVVKSCTWVGSPKDLILGINKHRVAEYLNKQFDNYAKKWNTKNQMDFELENISESGIWLAKKKYLLNLVWESGIDIDPMTQIIFKGIELAQSSTPPFARTKLKELVKYVLTKKKGLKMPELTKMLRDIKSEFKLSEPDKIASARKINDYGKFIKNDTTKFEIEKGTPIHVRAAGYYNFMLNSISNTKSKDKYNIIRQGDKVKFYYAKAKAGEENAFAFLPGQFPYEFAPEMDYDTMFSKIIIDPVNRIVVAMKLPPIPPGLQIAHALF